LEVAIASYIERCAETVFTQMSELGFKIQRLYLIRYTFEILAYSFTEVFHIISFPSPLHSPIHSPLPFCLDDRFILRTKAYASLLPTENHCARPWFGDSEFLYEGLLISLFDPI